MFTKTIKSIFAVAAVAVVAISCAKNPTDNVISASCKAQPDTSIAVSFIPGADVQSVEYFVGSPFNMKMDSIAFAAGDVAYPTVAATAKGFSFKSAQADKPFTIFLRPIAKNGQKGAVTMLQAVAGAVDYKISYSSLNSFVYTAPENIGTLTGIGFIAFPTSTPEEWGMTAEEIIETYVWGLTPTAAGESAMVELNGDPDIDHIMGVIFWDENYDFTYSIVNFTSGHYLWGAAQATIDVKVEKISDETADLVFTPSANTYGYCYKLYTKKDYDETCEKAKGLGKEPIAYIRELAAAGGSMKYGVQTDNRTELTPDTEYVLACFPYNVNGTQGWGKSEIVEFKTLAE